MEQLLKDFMAEVDSINSADYGMYDDPEMVRRKLIDDAVDKLTEKYNSL